jgi:hypothetical protein
VIILDLEEHPPGVPESADGLHPNLSPWSPLADRPFRSLGPFVTLSPNSARRRIRSIPRKEVQP